MEFLSCGKVYWKTSRRKELEFWDKTFFCLGDPLVCWVVAGIFTIKRITQRAQVRMISGALFQNRRSVLGQLECFLWLILCSHSLLQAGCALRCGAASWQWQQQQNESHTLHTLVHTILSQLMRERAALQNHIVHISRWFSGACCQAALIGTGCWVGCLPTNEPLQGWSWDRLSQVSWARLFCSTS